MSFTFPQKLSKTSVIPVISLSRKSDLRRINKTVSCNIFNIISTPWAINRLLQKDLSKYYLTNAVKFDAIQRQIQRV